MTKKKNKYDKTIHRFLPDNNNRLHQKYVKDMRALKM